MMRKIVAVVLCAALMVLAFGVAVQAKQPKFLVLGDSIAAGSGVRNKKDAYAWIVAREKGWELTNRGAGGDISADLRRKVAQDKTIRREIRGADVIAVSIGGNDLLHAEDFTRLVIEGLLGDYSQMQPVLDAFRENFGSIIKGIRALNPKAKLIVQTLYNPAFPLPSLRVAYGAAVQGINASIHAYLAAHPGAFVLADVYEAFLGRRGMVSIDMTHPAAAGHKVIAAVLLNAIDAKQAPLPSAGVLNALEWISKPALWVLDMAAIRIVLRALYGVALPVLALF